MSEQKASDFNTDLQRAWDFRNSQNLAKADEFYQKIRRANMAQTTQNPYADIQLSILKASLLRAQGEIVPANTVLDQVKTDCERHGFQPTDHYYLQKGLNLFYEGYFPSALEFFIQCDKVTQDEKIRTMALGNQLLCLDNLNLSGEAVYKKLLKQKDKIDAEYFERTITPSLESYWGRQLLHQGRIAKLLDLPKTESVWQLQWLQLWAAHLPYVKSTPEQQDAATIASSARLLWKNYRLKTILMESRYDSAEQVKISEKIDRLYLWTWRWLVNPDTVDASVYIECWNEIEPHAICSKSTSEDLVLIRLCLRWARLFNPQWQNATFDWLSKSLPGNLVSPPLFELEGKILDYLEAVQGKKRSVAARIKKELAGNSLFNSRELRFKEILDPGKTKSDLSTIVERLSDKNKKPVRSKDLTIDLANSSWKKDGESGVSAPVCKLIYLMSQKNVITFAEVLHEAFDIPYYESDVHNAKVMNLLTRVRKLLPKQVALFTRQEKIYVESDTLKVKFHRPSKELVLPLAPFLSSPCIKQNQNHLDRWIQPRILMNYWNAESSFSRQDLQDKLKLSKASANRLLTRWCNEGFLQSQNIGRSTSYRIDMTNFSRLRKCAS